MAIVPNVAPNTTVSSTWGNAAANQINANTDDIADHDELIARMLADSTWVAITPATGYTSTSSLRRVGSTLTLALFITRTGASIGTPTNGTLASFSAAAGPTVTIAQSADVTSPGGSCRVIVNAGTGVIDVQRLVINTGAVISANFAWNIALP